MGTAHPTLASFEAITCASAVSGEVAGFLPSARTSRRVLWLTRAWPAPRSLLRSATAGLWVDPCFRYRADLPLLLPLAEAGWDFSPAACYGRAGSAGGPSSGCRR